MGSRTGLGWFLDAQRSVACPDCSLARVRVLRSRVQPAGSIIFRSDCVVLDRSPALQHVFSLLHRSLSAAPPLGTDPLYRTSAFGYRSMFCNIFAARCSITVDPTRTADRNGNCRLCLGDVSLRGTTFRCSFALPKTRRPQLM